MVFVNQGDDSLHVNGSLATESFNEIAVVLILQTLSDGDRSYVILEKCSGDGVINGDDTIMMSMWCL